MPTIATAASRTASRAAWRSTATTACSAARRPCTTTLGAKGEWLERRLYADVVAFYMKRKDMQVSTGIQEDGIAGGYIFVTDNAAEGRNSGLEASVRWRATERFELGGALGLLHTSYYGYRPTGEDVGNREQPHAPEYQLSLNATWRHPLGWLARVDFAAIDDYYFDVPPAN